MKKCWILVLALLLAGCSQPKSMETVSDEYVQPVAADKWQLIVDIPLDAGVQVMESAEQGKLYFCDGYLITVQTVDAGDLDKTLRSATGYPAENLNLMKTQQAGNKRYDGIFLSAGEGETNVGRVCVLDDGNYHYVVTAMASEDTTGSLTQVWNDLFSSIRLLDPEIDLNSGS